MEIDWKSVSGAALIGLSILGMLLRPVVSKLWPTTTLMPPTPVPSPSDIPTSNTDAPAPTGVTEYLKVIEGASPTATPEIRWSYATVGMTEAAVLRAEVSRLGSPKI